VLAESETHWSALRDEIVVTSMKIKHSIILVDNRLHQLIDILAVRQL